jgi:hypothetical protein
VLQRLACLSLLTAILASCSDRPPSTVILALSSEAPLPQGVQSMTIKVRRGGVVYHDETYHVADKADASKKTLLTVDDIPGTLTIQDDGRATGPVSVSVEATLATAGGVTRKTIRAATVSFVDEKQKLLRMPIQLACSDITGGHHRPRRPEAGPAPGLDQHGVHLERRLQHRQRRQGREERHLDRRR